MADDDEFVDFELEPRPARGGNDHAVLGRRDQACTFHFAIVEMLSSDRSEALLGDANG